METKGNLSTQPTVPVTARLLSVMRDVFVSYDYFAWVNPYVYWFKTPLGILTATLAVAFLLAVVVGTDLFWAAGTILAIVLIGTLWPALSIRGLQGEFSYARRRVSEGEPVGTSLTLINRFPWPVWGITCQRDSKEQTTSACSGLPGSSKATFEWSFTPQQRGMYPRGECRLATSFPFGVHTRSRPTDAQNTLIVWPRTVALTSLLDAAETRPSDDRFTDAGCSESGDVLGVRPFRNGDSLRRVHWPQTARTGSLVVCERQAPATSAVRIVFERNPDLHETIAGESSLEWSIRIAASIAMAYHREQAVVECCIGKEIIRLSQGTVGQKQFLDRLATLEPRDNIATANHHNHHHDRTGRSSGMFQINITSLRGLKQLSDQRPSVSDQLWIVLTSTADSDDPSRHPFCGGRTLWIRDDDDPLVAFQKSWEHLCHVG
ncbi:MAG: DUF58 domain-containing protein [Pirellulales bacterium]